MGTPPAQRPYMPGYGILDADAGTGLLPWSWALERLTRAHDYWVATRWPTGEPHLMPVWAVWLDDGLWFSSSNGSRKARNLAVDPRCTIATDDPAQPVVVDGVAERVTDRDRIGRFLEATNTKYETDYPIGFLDPNVNSSFFVSPSSVFGLVDEDFTGSPTRWTFVE
jgi:general stress protein 26